MVCIVKTAMNDTLVMIRMGGNFLQVWEYIEDVASGLSHIHKHGVLHLDIKPENIFIDGQGRKLPIWCITLAVLLISILLFLGLERWFVLVLVENNFFLKKWYDGRVLY